MEQLSELMSNSLSREWYKQTLNHESMKCMLAQMQTANDLFDPEARSLQLSRLGKSFFEFSESELKKIKQFYVTKLLEMKRTLAVLSVQYRRVQSLRLEAPARYTPHVLHLLKAYGQLYLDLVQLKKFQYFNRSKMMRIMTKYDRMHDTTIGVTYAKRSCVADNYLSLHGINTTIGNTGANIESLILLLEENRNTYITFSSTGIVIVILLIFAVIISRI